MQLKKLHYMICFISLNIIDIGSIKTEIIENLNFDNK
jgi:hypothetical protein